MNIYDTKSILCNNCKVSIGEIDYDAEVVRPLCGKCANPLPEGDNALYTISHFQNNPPSKKSKILI
ncbi:MAG: hypothetical protein OEM18_02800 [Nitrosopumilus sp.]|nr:hypothetical protein [Nitrosopumilus sp.]MDH3502822.1 hypothetical protein [Nitrosopumilus sp.]